MTLQNINIGVMNTGRGEFELNLVDRFGNSFPSKIVNKNENWDLRNFTPFDFADLYLSRLLNPPSGAQETAVIQFFTDMVDAGVFQKAISIHLITGGSAVDHSWNSRYPFDNRSSNRLNYVGSPVHNSNGISTNGTSNGILTNVSFIGSEVNNRQMSIYKRNISSVANAGGIAFGSNVASTAGMFYRPNINGVDSNYSGGGNLVGLPGGATLNNGLISVTSESKFYRNGVQIASGTVSADYHNYVAIGGVAGTSSFMSAFSPVDLSYSYIGDILSGSQELDHYNIVQALQTALGRQV